MSNPKADLHNINAHIKFAENQLRFTQAIVWIYAYRQQNALCQQEVWILRFKTAEILISLRFSHLISVHFNFEERDFSVSAVAQTRTNIW